MPKRMLVSSQALMLIVTLFALSTALAGIVARHALGANSPAAAFTSTQSGSWGDAATWGGGGVPGCSDDVTISAGHVVTMDANRCANNLTIDGTLDLTGFELNFSGNNVAFTNNGTFTNTGSFNRMICANGGANQTIGGAGTYSGNVRLESLNTNWHIAPGTVFNFNSASDNVNVLINSGAVIDAANVLEISAPSNGAYIVAVNGGGVAGNGGLELHGHVRIEANSPINAPVHVVSGATRGLGNFHGNLILENGTSFTLVANAALNGSLTIPTGAEVDIAGWEMGFHGNGTTLSNNGTFMNSGSFSRLVSANGGAQQTITGTGTYGGNVRLENFSVNWNIADGTVFNFSGPSDHTNIQIDNGSGLNLANSLTVVATTGGTYLGIENAGTIAGSGGLKTEGNLKVDANAAPITAPIEVVGGEARASGSFLGNFVVDSGASVTLLGNMGLSGNLSIADGATIDMAGFEINSAGNGTAVRNDGTLTSSGAGNRLVFTNGGSHQTISGNGTYGGNVKIENLNVNLTIASGSSVRFGTPAGNTNIQIDTGGNLLFAGPGSVTLSGGVVNDGMVHINDGGSSCSQGNRILVRSTVPGEQRSWTGGGSYSMTNLDVQDQAGTSAITVTGGVNSGNNGPNWTIGGCPCAAPAAGRVAWWRAEGDAVDAVGGHHGTVQSGTSFGSGQVGRTFIFSTAGDSGVNVPHSTDLDVNPTGFTGEFWMRSNGPAGGQVTLLEKSHGWVDSTGWAFQTNPAGDRLAFFIGAGGGGTTNFVGAETTVDVFDGNLHHIAGTWDGSNVRIYLDGALQGTTPFTSPVNNTRPINFGYTWGGGSGQRHFNGLIDETAIYNRALSDSEIAAISTASSSGTCILSRADFDGDNRTDVSVFRGSEGIWYSDPATGFRAQPWGIDGDIPVPGDYDNDRKTDLAVFRGSSDPDAADFFVLNSSDGTVSYGNWGLPGDIPVVADYDGDGRNDFAVWRPDGAFWFVQKSGGGTIKTQFGATGDVPLVMDYEGDGKANLTVFRPAEGRWYIAKPVGVPAEDFYAVDFGLNGDRPVPADYDGDGVDDIAVFRPDSGIWYLMRSSDSHFAAMQFGQSGDIPVPGDYDGDSKDDVAVYRHGVWYVTRDDGNMSASSFGLSSDIPIPNRYIP